MLPRGSIGRSWRTNCATPDSMRPAAASAGKDELPTERLRMSTSMGSCTHRSFSHQSSTSASRRREASLTSSGRRTSPWRISSWSTSFLTFRSLEMRGEALSHRRSSEERDVARPGSAIPRTHASALSGASRCYSDRSGQLPITQEGHSAGPIESTSGDGVDRTHACGTDRTNI